MRPMVAWLPIVMLCAAACSEGASPSAPTGDVVEGAGVDTRPDGDGMVDVTTDGDLAADADVNPADLDATDLPDAEGTGDATPDGDAAGDGDVSPADLDVPDLPEAADGDAGPECAIDLECEGKVSGLGACEVPTCLPDGTCGKHEAGDGTACTAPCLADATCQAGTCKGTTVVCPSPGPCRRADCVPGQGCVTTELTGPCDDATACTAGDTCAGGVCKGTPVPCLEDGNPCTVDLCDPVLGCQHLKVLDGTPCDDASACATGPKTCVGGTCTGTRVDCNDNEVCTTDTCVPATGCVHAPAPGPCDDGKWCTRNDSCDGQGKCTGEPLSCDDGNACTTDTCDEGVRGCVNLATTGGACDDGNACTGQDSCVSGQCRGVGVACDNPPPDTCKDDGVTRVSWATPGTCSDGTCGYRSQDVTCPSGCQAGVCAGDPCAGLDCSVRPGACFQAGTCVGGSCSYPVDDQATCDDQDPCTTGDACTNGTCAGVRVTCATPPVDTCADAKTLRTHGVPGTCSRTLGCVYADVMKPCPGGCLDGVCVAQPGLWQADFTSGGLGSMGQDPTGSCALPGWVEAGTTASDTQNVFVGFEP